MCCWGCAPPQHSHTVHPDGRSSSLRAHGLGGGDSIPATNGTRLPAHVHRRVGLEGTSVSHLAQEWISALVEILFELFQSLQTVQGMLRPSCLALLIGFLEKMGYEISSSLSYVLSKCCHARFEVMAWHSIMLSQVLLMGRIIWDRVVTQASWEQSWAWGANTECERDWPALPQDLPPTTPAVLGAVTASPASPETLS